MKYAEIVSTFLSIGLFLSEQTNASTSTLQTHGGVRGASTTIDEEEDRRLDLTLTIPPCTCGSAEHACIQTYCEYDQYGRCLKDYSNCGGLFQLILKTDKNPREISWHLTQQDPITGDGQGVILRRAPDYYKNSLEIYNQFDSIDGTGCYAFTIFDNSPHNDGICCDHGDGYYKIKYDGVEVAAGARYGQSATHFFGSGCWRQIFFENFENGFGKFKDGGQDAKIAETYYYGGAAEGKSLRLRDNTNSGKATTAEYNVGLYSAVRINFYFMTRAFEAAEGFVLEYITNRVNGWQNAGMWVKGTDFSNDQWLNDVVTVTFDESSYPQVFKFRFRCVATGDSDLLYIDNVKFEGLSK